MSTVHQADIQSHGHGEGHPIRRDGDRAVQPGVSVLLNGSANGTANGTVGVAAAVKGKGLFQSTAKRTIDVVVSLLGLLVTAPLVAVLAALIRLDSRGPVFYRQTRVGRDGRPFELVKLRTMYEGQGVHATRIGRILRPMGLDELPQFWNVLAGHMSVVGPRPERPHLVAEYESKLRGYAGRHAVRPGITGWAQINGLRGGSGSISDRLRFDLDYVRSWNAVKDLQILALTVTAVWRDTRRELRR